MKTYKIQLPDFGQLRRGDINSLISSSIPMFATLGSSWMRWITYVQPWEMEDIIEERRQVQANTSEMWQRAHFEDELQLLRKEARGGKALRVVHYLLTEKDDWSADDFRLYGFKAEEAVLPNPLKGRHIERQSYFEPQVLNLSTLDGSDQYVTDNNRFNVSVLVSHKLLPRDVTYQTFMKVIREATGPVALAFDFQKLGTGKVRRAMRNRIASVDPTSSGVDQEIRNSYDLGLQMLNQIDVTGERFHKLTVAAMVLDKNPERLKERSSTVRRSLESVALLNRALGRQKDAIKFFAPIRDVSSIQSAYTVTTGYMNAVGALAGFTSQTSKEGILTGKRVSSGGISAGFHYLKMDFKNKEACHANIYGMTGMGKTVFARALLHRAAMSGIQTFVLDPQDHVREHLKLMGEENASYQEVGFSKQTVLNPLDVVWDSPSRQYQHLATVITLMLDPRGEEPRRLTTFEVAAINRAANLTYAGYEWEELLGQQHLSPTLEMFCIRLDQIARDAKHERSQRAASGLAEELRSLYVDGDWSEFFNGTSTLDIRFDKMCVIFNLKELFNDTNKGLTGLWYYIILSNINRHMRATPEEPQIIYADEFGFMMRHPMIVSAFATIYKTMRSYRGAAWLIDQDPSRIIGIEGSVPSGDTSLAEDRLSIVSNTPIVITGGLLEKAAEQLARLYPAELLETHVEEIKRWKRDSVKGRFAVIAGGSTQVVNTYGYLLDREVKTLL